jgi:hypothetical protein
VIWRDYLTADEIERLAEIDRAKKAGQAEQRRISRGSGASADRTMVGKPAGRYD